MINSINIALSGLEAASKRLQASASNIANLHTAGSIEEGGQAPYQAQTTTQQAIVSSDGQGASVKSQIVQADKPFVPSYDPDSPFANEDGLIGVPNINLAQEAVNMSLAELSYKANIETLEATQENAESLLDIFDDE